MSLIEDGDSCYNAPMENTEHSKHTTIEDEVEVTDLPELSASRNHRSSKLLFTMLGWQRSINRRSWRLAGAISTGLLALVALLVIFSSLHNTLTPPPGKPLHYPTPTIHYDYIYRDHPTAMYSGHFDEVLAVAWSPDGTRIASGSDDGTCASVGCQHWKTPPHLSWWLTNVVLRYLVSRWHSYRLSAALTGTVQDMDTPRRWEKYLVTPLAMEW